MDTWGFLPRLDIFKAMAEKFTQEEGWGSLGLAWLPGYLNQHPALSTRFASTMDHQRAFANAPGPIKDYFQKLRDVIVRYKIREVNMWNMSEKGFTLGTANHAKVIACAGRHPPRAIHDGTHGLITVIECCGARLKMLVPMVVFKSSAYCRGWYPVVTKDTPGHFAYSPKGYSTSEIGLEWLRNSMQKPYQPLLLSTTSPSRWPLLTVQPPILQICLG